MLFRLQPEVLALLIPVLLFALVFHEFSHGWVAYKLGDPTAKHQGRLTLNPIAHLDPFGSLMILFVGFGWAKPVPVDSRYLANPRVDMMKIAFAGPASNLLLALISGILIRLTGYMGPLTSMLILFTQINISLAVFNMIPIPPLDGSQIFSGLMIRKIRTDDNGMPLVKCLKEKKFGSQSTITVPSPNSSDEGSAPPAKIP